MPSRSRTPSRTPSRDGSGRRGRIGRDELVAEEAEEDHVLAHAAPADRLPLPPLLDEAETPEHGERRGVPRECLRGDPSQPERREPRPAQVPGRLRGVPPIPVGRVDPVRQALDLAPGPVDTAQPDAADAPAPVAEHYGEGEMLPPSILRPSARDHPGRVASLGRGVERRAHGPGRPGIPKAPPKVRDVARRREAEFEPRRADGETETCETGGGVHSRTEPDLRDSPAGHR